MVSAAHWHNLDGSPIIVTENVLEYRKAIAEYVTPEDTVLEVGCAEGLTTALISQTAKQAFGVDKSASQVSKAVQRHQHIPNLHFQQIDAWDLTAVKQLATQYNVTFEVIFIDVSGSRKVGDVESLLVKYEQVFQPRLFVVKCYQLKRLVNRCQLFTPVPRVNEAAGLADAFADADLEAAQAEHESAGAEFEAALISAECKAADTSYESSTDGAVEETADA